MKTTNNNFVRLFLISLGLSISALLYAQTMLIPEEQSDDHTETNMQQIPNVGSSQGQIKVNDNWVEGLLGIDNASYYAFSQSIETYNSISGGTLVAASVPGIGEDYLDDFNFSNQPISFSFIFNGTAYSSYNINTNGYITFGDIIPSPGSSAPISSNIAYDGAISAFGRDLDGRFTFQATTTAGSNILTNVSHFGGIVTGKQITGTGISSGTVISSFNASAGTITLSANSTASGASQSMIAYTAEIRRITVGPAPNRIHILQFRNFKRTGPSAFGEVYNFQIWLFETSNQIRIVYGPHVGISNSTAGQIGLRGSSGSDFNNRTTTTNWSATNPGATNTATCTMSNSVFPPSGLTFIFTPPPQCITPLVQPSKLALNSTLSAISGSFSGAPDTDGYLVVRTTSDELTALPVNGTTYNAGDVLGNGTIVYRGSNNTFTSSGLTSSTTYYFFIFSMNDICLGGPKYLTTVPLTGSATTLPNPPSSFTATSAGQTQINLSATTNAAGDQLMVAWNFVPTFGTPTGEYDPGDPIAGGGTVHFIGDATSLTNHTGLTPGTTYYYRAWSLVSGPDYSTSSILTSAFTTCDTIAVFPFNEDFDGMTFPPSACWERFSGMLASPSVLTPIQWGWVHSDWRNIPSGDKAARVNIYGDFVNYWFVTPTFDLGAGGYQLEFDLCLVKWNTSDPPDLNGTDDRFAVVISPDNGVTWTSANILRVWDNAGSQFIYNSINPEGETMIIDIGSYSGPVKIAFYGESTAFNADNDLMINNIKVRVPPGCAEPSNLSTSNLTTDGVRLNWNDIYKVNKYFIVWGLHGFNPDNSQTWTGSFEKIYPFQPGAYFHDITGLFSGIEYQTFIRSDCGDEVSAWSGPVTFNTLCPVASLPFSEFFNDDQIPSCWTQFISGSVGSERWGLKNTVMAQGNLNEIKARGTKAIGISRLITPPLDLEDSQAVLRFRHFYHDQGLQFNKAVLKIQSSADGVSWSNEPWSLTSGNGNSAPGTVLVNISANTGSNVYLSWVIDGNHADIQHWYIDDVFVFTPQTGDAATISIDLPDVVHTATIIPTATVANLGTNIISFDVQMAIGNYSSIVTVNNLLPLGQVQVSFDPWIAEIGDYSVMVCSEALSDPDQSNDCMLKTIKVKDLSKLVYGYITLPGGSSHPKGPASFTLSEPGNLVSIDDQSALNFVSGGTWANGLWYGTVNSNQPPYHFITINPSTGSRTIIDNMGVNMTGLSYNALSGIMYAVGYDGIGTSRLYTINMITGSATLVGICGTGMLISLAVNNSGDAYSVNITDDIFGSVDLATGAFTPIGPTGFNGIFAQDMEFDRDTDQLYITAYDYKGWLGLADVNTGYVSRIGDFEGGSEITGFAIPSAGLIEIGLKVFMEGPYDSVSNAMITSLFSYGLIPFSQPFNPPLPYFNNMYPEWLYAGTESVSDVPQGVVDWVLVQFRDAVDAISANGSTVIGTAAAFLKADGSIVGLDGESNLFIPATLSQNLFVVVYHRNHLAIMSSGGLTLTGDVYSWDFTTGAGQVYGSMAGYKKLKNIPEVWGMVAADGNADGQITMDDKNIPWAEQAGMQGYLASDYDLDSQTENVDKIELWLQNYNQGFESQVPE